MQYKILPKALHIFKSNCLFLFYGFSTSAHFLFFFSNVMMRTCVNSDWLHIEQKWCIEKDKTPKAVFLIKVSNKGVKGIIWNCSNRKYKLPSFVDCHLWVFLACKTFMKQIFFRFLDHLTLIFLLYSHCSKCAKF